MRARIAELEGQLSRPSSMASPVSTIEFELVIKLTRLLRMALGLLMQDNSYAYYFRLIDCH